MLTSVADRVKARAAPITLHRMLANDEDHGARLGVGDVVADGEDLAKIRGIRARLDDGP